jgi:hypothetical protein
MSKRNGAENAVYVNGKHQKIYENGSPTDPAYVGVKSGSLADPSEPVNDPKNSFNSDGVSDAAIREWSDFSKPSDLKRKRDNAFGGTKRKKRRRNNKKTKRNRK